MTNSLRLFGSVSREPTLGDHLDAAMPGVGWIGNLPAFILPASPHRLLR